MKVQLQISPGELLDRITILEIKTSMLRDPGQVKNVRHDLELHRQARDSALPFSPALQRLELQLREVNLRLWQIEDAIRLCEAGNDFGPHFIKLARAVYITNDRRSLLKRDINELLDSEIVEEKSYQDYGLVPTSSGQPV